MRERMAYIGSAYKVGQYVPIWHTFSSLATGKACRHLLM